MVHCAWHLLLRAGCRSAGHQEVSVPGDARSGRRKGETAGYEEPSSDEDERPGGRPRHRQLSGGPRRGPDRGRARRFDGTLASFRLGWRRALQLGDWRGRLGSDVRSLCRRGRSHLPGPARWRGEAAQGPMEAAGTSKPAQRRLRKRAWMPPRPRSGRRCCRRMRSVLRPGRGRPAEVGRRGRLRPAEGIVRSPGVPCM